MKISIGSDHRGYEFKKLIKKEFFQVEWIDVGTDSAENRVDYPLFAKKVCKEVLSGNVSMGILICGSGVGMAIAANRFPTIYAALCWNSKVAQMAREHDYANILVFPADFISFAEAIEIVRTWLDTKFKGDYYQKRLEMIDE